MISIQVDYEVASKIVVCSLLETIEDMKRDYDSAKQTGVGKVFSIDAKEDMKELKKLLKGLIRVHNFYTPFHDHLEIKDYV